MLSLTIRARNPFPVLCFLPCHVLCILWGILMWVYFLGELCRNTCNNIWTDFPSVTYLLQIHLLLSIPHYSFVLSLVGLPDNLLLWVLYPLFSLWSLFFCLGFFFLVLFRFLIWCIFLINTQLKSSLSASLFACLNTTWVLFTILKVCFTSPLFMSLLYISILHVHSISETGF